MTNLWNGPRIKAHFLNRCKCDPLKARLQEQFGPSISKVSARDTDVPVTDQT